MFVVFKRTECVRLNASLLPPATNLHAHSLQIPFNEALNCPRPHTSVHDTYSVRRIYRPLYDYASKNLRGQTLVSIAEVDLPKVNCPRPLIADFLSCVQRSAPSESKFPPSRAARRAPHAAQTLNSCCPSARHACLPQVLLSHRFVGAGSPSSIR